MFFFITVLRALAAALITNAHYTGIYPTDLIANGGLIGDILFFAVSGYCLCNIKVSFFKWYRKRLFRVYLPVILISVIYGILGFYSITVDTVFLWFVYPTYYHFVASIVILYIPFYVLMKIDWFKSRLIWVMVSIAIIWLLLYLLLYDKTYYHLDNVHEPMIRLLFFESMLLGAYFRFAKKEIRNHFRWSDVIGTLVFLAIYFISKLSFLRMESISYLQFMNQINIFLLLIFLFRLFAGMDSKLEKLPMWCKTVITFISDMTLEIYVVQYVLIDLLRGYLFFPVNWILITASIIISAWILHIACKGITALCKKIVAGKSK